MTVTKHKVVIIGRLTADAYKDIRFYLLMLDERRLNMEANQLTLLSNVYCYSVSQTSLACDNYCVSRFNSRE